MKKNSVKKIEFDFGCAAVIAALLLILSYGIHLGGLMPWQSNPYNSYVLQAQAWLDGRLDLGTNYEHLEIAVFNEKYFISFPPFPSYVYLPFVFLFGDKFRDGWFCVLSFISSGIFVYGIFRHFGIKKTVSTALSVMFTAGTNLLFVSVNSWVWFIAQNMCFALTTGSIFSALRDRRALSFALLSCAVGCRPFQLLYFPLLMMIMYQNEKKNGTAVFSPKHLLPFIAPVIIGGSYMLLNYARFGNPIEFGHNYLPEFTEAPDGQFSPVYLLTNLYSLIRLPEIIGGQLVFQMFDGFNIFVASPALIYAAFCFAQGLRAKKTRGFTLLCLIIIAAELLCITAHKTMGGWHYGNRYTIDTIPAALFITAYCLHGRSNIPPVPAVLLTAIGTALNLYWISIF